MVKWQIMSYFLLLFLGVYNANQLNYNNLILSKIDDYCNNLIINKEKLNKENFLLVNDKNIFTTYIFIKYIESNQQYLENKLQFTSNKITNFFLWQIIPDVDIKTFDFTEYNINFNISQILESLFNNIFPYELNKIIYQQKELEKELILGFQEQLVNLIKVIGNIRSKYRSFQYLLEEFQKKKHIFEILPENELETVYELENHLLQVSMELINLFNELEETIIKSNFILTQEHVKNIFYLYEEIFSHIKENTKNYKQIENLNLEELKFFIQDKYLTEKKRILLKKPLLPKNNNIFNKLPISIRLSIEKIFTSIINKNFSSNFTFSLSLSELVNIIIGYFFERKIFNINKLNEDKKWTNLKKNQELNNINLENKHINMTHILNILNKILTNEELLSVVKMKKIINNHIEFINTQEEIITNILIKILYDIVKMTD